jgi:hypothetical protein
MVGLSFDISVSSMGDPVVPYHSVAGEEKGGTAQRGGRLSHCSIETYAAR